LKLNIGAGKLAAPAPNQVNTDIYPGPHIDKVFDACKAPWPFHDNEFDSVVANHTLEHLSDPWVFFKESYRVLKPSAIPNLFLRLPAGASDDAMGDLTHIRPYMPMSFASVQLGYNDAIYNPQYDHWDTPFEIIHVLQRVNKDLRWLMKPVIRCLGMKVLPFLWNAYTEMVVTLRALKTEDDRTRFKIRNQANAIPIARFMYESEYKGRPLGPEEYTPRMLFFGEQSKELQVWFDKQHKPNGQRSK